MFDLLERMDNKVDSVRFGYYFELIRMVEEFLKTKKKSVITKIQECPNKVINLVTISTREKATIVSTEPMVDGYGYGQCVGQYTRFLKKFKPKTIKKNFFLVKTKNGQVFTAKLYFKPNSWFGRNFVFRVQNILSRDDAASINSSNDELRRTSFPPYYIIWKGYMFIELAFVFI